jgi:hypothetical protein
MVARVAVVLAVIGLAACGGSAGGAFRPAAMPRGGDWTGTYFSDWGRLEMARTGDTVVGTFLSDIKHGRLSGSVNGDVMRFTWTQLDERIGGRASAVEGGGQFRYVVDANGEHHLEGTWGYAGEVSGGGVWNASKSRSRVRPRVGGTPGSEQGEGSGTESGGEEQTGGQPQPQPQPNPDGLDNLDL